MLSPVTYNAHPHRHPTTIYIQKYAITHWIAFRMCAAKKPEKNIVGRPNDLCWHLLQRSRR